MKILFVIPYPLNTAPSQRLKFEQYFSYFEKAGFECVIRPFMSKDFYNIVYKKKMYLKKVFYTLCGYFRRMISLIESVNCDLIYLHIEAAPFGPPIFEYIFKAMRRPIIYDFDDIVYLPHSSKVNRMVQFLKYPTKIYKIIRLSNHVMVVTRYLEEHVNEYNKNVTLFPPTIDTDRYIFKRPNMSKRICLGWSGSHSTSEYLHILERVLKKIKASYDVKIKVIGNKDFTIDGLDIESQDWRLESEIADLFEIDIGLYPLPKNEWVLGKGGGKALQYMAMGIPSVSTRFGEAMAFIEDGVNGFLADSEEEWIEKLSCLIEDPHLRMRIGLAGRKTVEEKYSVKVNAPKILEVIQNVYGNKYSNMRI